MKRRIITGTLTTLFLAGGLTLFAQNGPGRGQGYGGPPQSEAESAARQAACPQGSQGQGSCVTGQPRGQAWRHGQAMGKGAGRGHRHGLRDGTGPRSANGTCPVAADKPAGN